MNMDKLKFYIIKLLVILYVGAMYSLVASSFSYFIKSKIQKSPEQIKKNTKNKKIYRVKLVLHLLFEMGMINVAAYLVRQIIKKYLPWIGEGIYGFSYEKLKELKGSVVVAFSFFLFTAPSIKKKFDALYTHLIKQIKVIQKAGAKIIGKKNVKGSKDKKITKASKDTKEDSKDKKEGSKDKKEVKN